jgi:hypothetical protein
MTEPRCFMKTEKKQEWERIRARGLKRYLLLYGIIPWGIIYPTFSALFSAIYSFFSYDSNQESSGLKDSWLFRTISGCVIGVVIATVMWIKNEISISGVLRMDHEKEP